MDLTLTVVDASTASTVDLQVVAPDASPTTPVLDALRNAIGASPETTLTVNGVAVPTDGTVADCCFAPGMVVRAGAPARAGATPTAEIVVTTGADAARRRAADCPSLVIGRDPGCDLVLADPSVSRQHLLFTRNAGTTTVTDLGSANGTLLDGEALPADVATDVTIGSVLQVGDSELRVEAWPAPGGPMAASGVIVHRAPRLSAPAPAAAVTFPTEVAPRAPIRVPLIAAFTPLVAGVVLSLVLHQWQFLAFTALSPLMVLGQALGDRLSSRRAHRSSRREYDAATSTAHARLTRELAAERHHRHDAAPDLARLTGAVARRDPVLWQRCLSDPDALLLRLGRGDLPSDVQVVNGPGAATAVDVPVCISVLDAGVLGVCGPTDITTGLARSLVVQAATLHSPQQLRIVVLAPGRSREWQWARWLPHVAARGEGCSALFGFDHQQVANRVAELRRGRAQTGETHVLVVVDGAGGLLRSSAMAELLDDPGHDISVAWCARSARDLPGSCRAVVSILGGPRPVLRLTQSGKAGVVEATVDQLAADLAETAAREQAPLHDGSRGGGLPQAVRWLDASQIDLCDRESGARSLIQSWSHGPCTQFALGRGADGVVAVDLCRDGPHALIAGTTGSGKSELLVSIVSSLATRNRPDQLALLLIDHKGGAALGACARLPHAVGLVTDLDSASTQRALLSLTAELRRREAVLAAAGAADLEAYRGAESLARLVIVVDEFAALVDEQPDFVGGLVGIAQRGRSLGVHLMLATQRPDGVVSADIRANTRLRICLGVTREQESRDVIDTPAAASISRRTPGRAYLRVGPGDLHEFQTARIGGPRPAEGEVVVVVHPATALGDPPPAIGSCQDETDLDVLIDAAVAASARLECRPPPPPWLPPLPDDLPLSTQPQPGKPGVASWGMVDLPAAGKQQPLLVDAGLGGTVLIAGTGRSGRTTAATSYVTSLATRVSVDGLNLWAIDGAAGLAGLARLPQCGAVVPAHDTERVEALLGFLTREVVQRRHHPGRSGPALALVIDSWETLLDAHDDRERGQVVDTVLRLAAEGPSAMLHTVITGDRALLTGRLAGSASEKFVLRLADRSDFIVIGMPLRDLPRHLPPGRGVRASDLALVQIAQPTAATETAARRWPASTWPVRRFDPLPPRVSLDELRAPEGQPLDGVVLGVAADESAVVRLTRQEIGSAFLVTGSARSGRSSALLTIAGQLTGRRLAVSCTDRSPLAAMTGAVHLPRDDQDHAVAMLDALCSGTAVMPDLVVDDIDLLPDGRLSTRLEELLRAGPADDRVIAVSAAADVAAAVFRGPLVQARRGRTGLLLCPTSRQDGELFGIRLSRPALSDDPAGRGWLVRNGVATRLQVAFPAASLGDPAAGLSDGGHLRGGDVRRANLNGGELGGGDFGSARLLG